MIDQGVVDRLTSLENRMGEIRKQAKPIVGQKFLLKWERLAKEEPVDIFFIRDLLREAGVGVVE